MYCSRLKIVRKFQKPVEQGAVCAHEGTEELKEGAMGAGAAGMSGCA